MRQATLFAIACVALVGLPKAWGWSRPGHMVSAAIAYDDLAAHGEGVIKKISDIIAQHPDRAAFEVATAGAEGGDRDLRRFMECARWPDDARGTPYDHPTWHYADHAVDPRVGGKKNTAQSGQAIEALALNFAVASNPHASGAERALALCWVLHVGADMHQPLHAASLYSDSFADGDEGGNRQWVLDPVSNEPITLHWFWDSAVHRDDTPASVVERAKDIEKQYPRTALSELSAYAPWDFSGWSVGETWAIAKREAYSGLVKTGASKDSAAALPRSYVDKATQIAARRIAVAGYRLSDLLRAIAAEGAAH